MLMQYISKMPLRPQNALPIKLWVVTNIILQTFLCPTWLSTYWYVEETSRTFVFSHFKIISSRRENSYFPHQLLTTALKSFKSWWAPKILFIAVDARASVYKATLLAVDTTWRSVRRRCSNGVFNMKQFL